MSKIRNIAGGGQIFFCPGCKEPHQVNTASNGPRWTYNQDAAAPTFSPSILVTCDWGTEREVCHSFVTAGQIQFLGDCTHALANKAVPVPEWPYAPGKFGGIEEEAAV